MTKEEKEYLLNLFIDKMHEIEMSFFEVEMDLPESYDRAFFDKESGRYINLETYVRNQLSHKELKRKKEERIEIRETMQKEFDKFKKGELPTFSLSINVHQMEYSFYQNEFIPELNRIKRNKKPRSS